MKLFSFDKKFKNNLIIQDAPIREQLQLRASTYNYLIKNNIKSIKDLAKLTAPELINLKGIGAASYNEILGKLSRYNIYLKDTNKVRCTNLSEIKYYKEYNY